MAALQYWLWLSSAGLRPRAKAAILARYGDAEAAFFAPEGEFAELSGVSKSEAAALEKRDLLLAGQIQDACEEQGLRILTLQDADYPRRLRQIYSPPVVLYVKGRLPALDRCAPIAVIGTRHSSLYGLRMAATLSAELVQCGGVIVSPLTSAIEQESVRAALRAGGRCVAVLGTAHEQDHRLLTQELSTRGAVVSEYPPFTRPMPLCFRDRNRIAAGLSVGVLVVEAPEKSGTALFVSEAAEQGKEIFAVPGNLDTASAAGTLHMLQEGAHMATSGWDILREFEPLYPGELTRAQSLRKLAAPTSEEAPAPEKEAAAPKKKRKKKEAEPPAPQPEPSASTPKLSRQLEGLSEPQLRIVTALDGKEKHIDDIIEQTGLPTATVLAQLTVLQIKGFVRASPGRRFSLNIAGRL